MNPRELVLDFKCQDARLLGILCLPGHVEEADTGVVIVVGGPQYRVGSHRQFVLLARALAQAGHPCLRFDLRGMGDSEGSPRSFEACSEDIGAAVDALLAAQPQLRRVVLWGLCDAASASLMYWDQTRDARVSGLCLANPWVRSETSLAVTHVKHYYLQRLQSADFWRKLLSGAVAWRAVVDLLANLRLATRRTQTEGADAKLPFQGRMARAWHQFDGPLLLLLSGTDYTAKEFLETVASAPAWQAALGRAGLCRRDLPQADHTFSLPADQAEAERLTIAWLGEFSRRARALPTSKTEPCETCP